MSNLRRLNLGCGPGELPGDWINLDGSWNAWFSKLPLLRRVVKAFHLAPADVFDYQWSPSVIVHDVRKRLPFENNSLSAIYSSHVLEHLYYSEAKQVLKECYRVLEPRGILRVVVPDMRFIVMEYLRAISEHTSAPKPRSVNPADLLNQRLLFRKESPPSGNLFFRVYMTWNDFHSHKWMYDSESLCLCFRAAGFVEVGEMQFRQSRIDAIEAVEQAGRVLNGEGICVEGIKPRN